MHEIFIYKPVIFRFHFNLQGPNGSEFIVILSGGAIHVGPWWWVFQWCVNASTSRWDPCLEETVGIFCCGSISWFRIYSKTMDVTPKAMVPVRFFLKASLRVDLPDPKAHMSHMLRGALNMRSRRNAPAATKPSKNCMGRMEKWNCFLARPLLMPLVYPVSTYTLEVGSRSQQSKHTKNNLK